MNNNISFKTKPKFELGQRVNVTWNVNVYEGIVVGIEYWGENEVNGEKYEITILFKDGERETCFERYVSEWEETV